MASWDVEDEIVKSDMKMSPKRITQMTLSPLSRSSSPLFRFFAMPITVLDLQVSYSSLELFSPVLIAGEKVETCATRTQQYHIPVFRIGC